MLLKKLAVEKNYFKKLTIFSNFCITDFEKRMKKVKEII